MQDPQIPIEFHTDSDEHDLDLYVHVEDRIRKLTQGHKDITSVMVNVKKPVHERSTPYLYEATVVAYMRPENVAATEKSEQPLGALKGALDAVERQVRENRERLQEDRGSLDDFTFVET